VSVIDFPKNTVLTFSEEEELFRESVREFCQRHIAPNWVEVDKRSEQNPMDIPVDIIKKMADQGLFCIPCSEEYGGQGGSYTMATIAMEEIAYADPSVALAVYALLNTGWPFALELFGTEEACQEIIPEVAAGRAFFGIASTEPQGGSDVAGLKTRAEKKGDVYILNGEKTFISGVGEVQKLEWGGGWFTLARTGGEGHRGLSAFALLARKNGELSDGWDPTIYEDIGRHGLTTGGFRLTDFEVDSKYLIGEENKGFYHVMEGFNLARIVVAAATIGASRWLLEQAVEWFRTRKLFGRNISSFQGVSFKFADMYARWEASRYFVYRASRLADKIYIEKDPSYKPLDLNVPVALAKNYGPETCVDLAEEVMKWYGAYAYTKEAPIFRAWLGPFSYVIGAEGAQNIMRLIIARDIIGRDYLK